MSQAKVHSGSSGSHSNRSTHTLTLPNPEYDCDRTFGEEKFCFYHPLVIGEFVVNLWARIKSPSSSSSSSHHSSGNDSAGNWLTNSNSSVVPPPFQLSGSYERSFSLSVYQNGNFIRWDRLLNTSRLRGYSWANKLLMNSNATFSKSEIEEIFKFLLYKQNDTIKSN